MQEKFEVKNKKGQKIAGIVDGIEAGKKKPAVILLHGFKGFSKMGYIEYWAKRFSEEGLIAVRFDATNGLGESGGDIYKCTPSGHLNDLKSVINYVIGLDGVDKDRLCLLGTSMGGMVAFLEASTNESIKLLILHEPTYNWAKENMNRDLESWEREGSKVIHSGHKDIDFKISYNFYKDGLKYNNEEAVRRLKCPVLVITGKDGGDNTAMESTQEMYDNISSEKEMIVISGVPHSPKEENHLKEISEKVLGWIGKYL